MATIRFVALALTLPSLAATASPGLAKPASFAPVMVGGEAELDACGAIGKLKGTTKVLHAPNQGATVTATLHAGFLVWMCSDSKDGRFAGVVFGDAAQSRSPSGIPAPCGVSTPIGKAQPYRGPCRSGWIATSAIEMTAG